MLLRKNSSPVTCRSRSGQTFIPSAKPATSVYRWNEQAGPTPSGFGIERRRRSRAFGGTIFCRSPRQSQRGQRPKVFRQGDTFIVLLGRDVQDGIVGLGNTVESALRVFDLQYFNALPPLEARITTAKSSNSREVKPLGVSSHSESSRIAKTMRDLAIKGGSSNWLV